MQSICYIFGAGEHLCAPSSPTSRDLVIAADAGYLHAKGFGITPDICVGDFDSMDAPPDQRTIVLPPEKDDTDMLAAIRIGQAHGFRCFHIYGGAGNRLDHTLANLQCIANLAQEGMRGYLFDRDTVITAIHNSAIRFSATSRGILSAFAHSDIALGVDEVGLKYPLNNATLRNTYPIGVSNEFTGVESLVRVRSGTLLIIHPAHAQEI